MLNLLQEKIPDEKTQLARHIAGQSCRLHQSCGVAKNGPTGGREAFRIITTSEIFSARVRCHVLGLGAAEITSSPCRSDSMVGRMRQQLKQVWERQTVWSGCSDAREAGEAGAGRRCVLRRTRSDSRLFS